MYVCILHLCLVPKESKRLYLILGDYLELHSCELPVEYWDPYLGLLEELTVFLITWPSCQLFPLLVCIVLNESNNPLSFGTLILFLKNYFIWHELITKFVFFP